MSATAESPLRTLADVHPAELSNALAGKGVWLDVGIAMLRARSDAPLLAHQLKAVYGEFPYTDDADWADLHIEINRAPRLRRWIRPQVILRCDGQSPFDPFAADTALPLFEWGCNWLIGRRMNDLLLLHAGVVEKDGLALVLPALPGSGKSTLTAALSLRGWRLLSDEFGAFDPDTGAFRPVLKPIALKNESIGVIRNFAPHAVFGPEFPKTRKGTVAHLAPQGNSVARRHEGARPGAVVLPKWQAGSATRLERVPENAQFSALAFNAFNYSVLGATGFQSVVRLVRQCPAWQLIYSDLEEAVAELEAAWPQVCEHHVMVPQ